ncbi:terminase, partial [Streptosporangium sp. NPDC049644]
DCFWQKVRPIMERIWDPRARPDDSKRKYMNWPTAAQDAWMTPQAWSAIADPGELVADGEEIVAFFDGSKSRDATALVGCRISDGYTFTLGVWEPDTSHDTESVVPVTEVDAAVERMFDRWDVLAFFADVKEWEGFTKVTWPGRYADKLLVHAVPEGKDPQAIAWDMRARTYDFTLACELTETEINERAFRHDGDARVARHVGNARRRPNRWGVSIGKESPDSPKKIDAAVCVIGARMVRRLVLASPKYKNRKKKTSGRVYGF